MTTTTETLGKKKMRRLSRYVCGACEQNLDKVERYGCASLYGKCDRGTQKQRRDACLADYNPREKPPVNGIDAEEIAR